MRRFFPKRRTGLSKRKRSKHRLKSACLSLALATAWGSEATADATLKVEITPEQALANALVFYGNNVSTGVLASLGAVPGGQTSTFLHSLRDDVISSCAWVCDPEAYGAGGIQPAVYAVIGLYDGADGIGVTVSFPNDDPIVQMETWSSIFESSSFSFQNFAEAEIIEALLDAEPVATVPPIVAADRIPSFMRLYAEGTRGGQARLGSEYGHASVLVNFSDAKFGGTAVVSLVPEPTTCCFLISAAGIVTCFRRRSRAC